VGGFFHKNAKKIPDFVNSLYLQIYSTRISEKVKQIPDYPHFLHSYIWATQVFDNGLFGDEKVCRSIVFHAARSPQIRQIPKLLQKPCRWRLVASALHCPRRHSADNVALEDESQQDRRDRC
jgi:hypothetical protein